MNRRGNLLLSPISQVLRCRPRPNGSFGYHEHALQHASHKVRCRQVRALTTVISPSASVKYTTDLYPELKRDSRFAKVSRRHVDDFKRMLDSDTAVIDGLEGGDDIEPFNQDWMRKYRGHARVVLKPKNSLEVSKILRYCNEQMLAVVPQGGNSGLVGGGVPVFDEIIINLSRMNEIRSFDEISGALVVDAGVVMENADNYLRERGHIYPLDLGAKGSAQIGGNLAANAGGLRYLRYGSLHGTVLGIEAVLPDGTIMNDLNTLRKNNTGYDLKQLFIGGEGTIGIITAVAIHCPQKPNAVNVAFLGLGSYEAVQQTYKEAKVQLGEIMSAFELMDAESQDMVHTHTGKKRPLDDKHAFYCLIETHGSNADHDHEKLEQFLATAMEDELVADGVLAQADSQIQDLWSWREDITESMGREGGGVYKYDLSLPLRDLYSLVEATRQRLAMSPETHGIVKGVVGFGHMGDGNLHLNVSVQEYDHKVEAVLEPWVYEWVSKKHGSVSAEHGLGFAKKAFVGYSKDETMIHLMRQIKQLYDPNGIMMPYKYI